MNTHSKINHVLTLQTLLKQSREKLKVQRNLYIAKCSNTLLWSASEPHKLKPKYHILYFYLPTTLPNTVWYLGSPDTSGPTIALSFTSAIWSWSGSLEET